MISSLPPEETSSSGTPAGFLTRQLAGVLDYGRRLEHRWRRLTRDRARFPGAALLVSQGALSPSSTPSFCSRHPLRLWLPGGVRPVPGARVPYSRSTRAVFPDLHRLRSAQARYAVRRALLVQEDCERSLLRGPTIRNKLPQGSTCAEGVAPRQAIPACGSGQAAPTECSATGCAPG